METILRQIRPSSKQMYLDPRTKILLCLTVSTIILSGNNVGILRFLMPLLAGVPLVFLMILRKWGLVAYYAVMYVFSFTLPRILTPHLPDVINLLFTGVVAILSKMLPGMSMFFFLVLTTSVSEFVAAMDKLHVPKSITIPISVMFRFFPTIREEYAAIQEAMRLRGVGSMRKPAEMLEYRLVPLMMSLVSIGNELSASALTRGMNAPIRRTNLCPIGFHWPDMVAGLFSTMAIIVFIVANLMKI